LDDCEILIFLNLYQCIKIYSSNPRVYVPAFLDSLIVCHLLVNETIGWMFGIEKYARHPHGQWHIAYFVCQPMARTTINFENQLRYWVQLQTMHIVLVDWTLVIQNTWQGKFIRTCLLDQKQVMSISHGKNLKKLAVVLYIPSTLHFSLDLSKPRMLWWDCIIVPFMIWLTPNLIFLNLCLPVNYAL